MSVSESSYHILMALMALNYGEESQSGSAGEGQQSAEGSEGDSEHDAEATDSKSDSKDGTQEDEASSKENPPTPSDSAAPESILQPLMAILPSFIHSAFVRVIVTLDKNLFWRVRVKLDTAKLSEFGLQHPLVLAPSSGGGVVVSSNDTNYIPKFAEIAMYKYVMFAFGPEKLYSMNKGESIESDVVCISRGFENYTDIKAACKSVADFFATVGQEELDSFSFEQEQAAAVLLENFLIFAED